MALYATKNAFFGVAVFGENVQNRKKHPFGHFSQREESRSAFSEDCENSLLEVCTGFGLS